MYSLFYPQEDEDEGEEGTYAVAAGPSLPPALEGDSGPAVEVTDMDEGGDGGGPGGYEHPTGPAPSQA